MTFLLTSDSMMEYAMADAIVPSPRLPFARRRWPTTGCYCGARSCDTEEVDIE
jgi:hypothetical protein